MRRYMAATDCVVDKTLDVRRLFRIERLLSGLSSIVLDQKHLVALVKKQRHGLVIELKGKKKEDIDELLDLSDSASSEAGGLQEISAISANFNKRNRIVP